VTFRTRLRRAFGRRTGALKPHTVVGLVDLTADGGPRLVIAGVVEGNVVAIDEELAGNGRGRRFCHHVWARSAEAAEAEARAHFAYLHSLIPGDVG
jgi:hypothetical protein